MSGNQRSKIVGLTGPIGAGKSEVAKILKQQGAVVIDVDQLAHALYKPQSPTWQQLVRFFGSKILKRGGEINRKKLAKIVFSDRKKLQGLNRIVHPALREAIVEETEKIKNEKTKKLKNGKTEKLIVVNAAVLKEIGLLHWVDEVWVVMASKEERLKRLLKKGLSKETIKSLMQSQMSQREYLEMADVIIVNSGSLKQLKAKVEEIL